MKTIVRLLMILCSILGFFVDVWFDFGSFICSYINRHSYSKHIVTDKKMICWRCGHLEDLPENQL